MEVKSYGGRMRNKGSVRHKKVGLNCSTLVTKRDRSHRNLWTANNEIKRESSFLIDDDGVVDEIVCVLHVHYAVDFVFRFLIFSVLVIEVSS